MRLQDIREKGGTVSVNIPVNKPVSTRIVVSPDSMNEYNRIMRENLTEQYRKYRNIIEGDTCQAEE